MFINRVGTFFILLGLMLIGLFILSDIARAPSCNFLIFGVASIAFGAYLWFKDPSPPPQPTGRFRIFRSGKKQDKKN